MGVNRKNIPPELHARYGISTSQKYVLPTVASFLVVVVGVLLFIIGKDLNAGGDVRLITWQSVSANQVELTWSVQRNDNQSVTCVLRAQDNERFDVGYATVKVRNTNDNPTIVSRLNLRGPLTAVVEPECQAGEARTLVGPHFRPGLLPPAQTEPLRAPWQGLPQWLN